MNEEAEIINGMGMNSKILEILLKIFPQSR